MGLFNFFDRFKASSNDRSAGGDFFFEPVAARSASGIQVSPDRALRLSAVYACVRILSETMASLPLVIYRQRADGGKDRVTDHWLYHLLARRPNRFQNPFEWREMLQGHLAMRGNAFCQIISNLKGEITELMPLHPDHVRMEVMDNGDFRYRVRMQSGDEMVIPRGQIWHLRGLSSDGLMGMSPIELARESLGMALAAQDYGARFFRNDAKPTGGWIEFPGAFKDAEAKRVFRDSYQAAQAGSNRGKVLVLENGMKFHEVGVTNKDAQFLELRKFQITDIARLFRVPPHMIADLDRATFSNIEQQSLEFVMHTMTPWAERWEASIESDLMLDDDRLEIEFDFANLMRGDAASRSAYYQSWCFFLQESRASSLIDGHIGLGLLANSKEVSRIPYKGAHLISDVFKLRLTVNCIDTAWKPIATGGKLKTFIPWDTELWDFEPTSYQAQKRKGNPPLFKGR